MIGVPPPESQPGVTAWDRTTIGIGKKSTSQKETDRRRRIPVAMTTPLVYGRDEIFRG